MAVVAGCRQFFFFFRKGASVFNLLFLNINQEQGSETWSSSSFKIRNIILSTVTIT